jgi:isopenicillin N synthase-like dioxygenase
MAEAPQNPAADLDQDPVAAHSGEQGAVPLIDLDRSDAAAQIAAASTKWGFFQIVNHGLPAALIDAVWRQSRRFFENSAANKLAIQRTRENPWGYYNNELTKNRRDKKEVFDFTNEGTDPIYHASNRWPPNSDGFRATLRRYFAACTSLALELLDAYSDGLGLPSDHLRRLFEPGHTSFIRLNHYPVQDPLAGEWQDHGKAGLGVHHHTDAGALTVLLQDEVGGLQVHNNGYWHDIPSIPGALVVNTGDMMQVWSNDRYRAAMHRVLAMQQSDRYSIPYFFNPAGEADVCPLGATVDDAHPARYRPVRWAEFRGRRTDGDYADYGPEVQIDEYRIKNQVSMQ